MAADPVEPTELVAGGWQLRPWPAAHADLDDLLAERYDGPARLPERERRLGGWQDGTCLGFAVREITTGRSVGEVLAIVVADAARVEVWVRPGSDPRSIAPTAGDAVRRWVSGALGLSLH
jgi:hypothetical protein